MAEKTPRVNYFRHALPSSRFGIDLETRIENRERFDYLARRGRAALNRTLGRKTIYDYNPHPLERLGGRKIISSKFDPIGDRLAVKSSKRTGI